MATSPAPPVETPKLQYPAEARSVEGRYLDGYREANLYTGLGATVKKASLVVGGAIAVLVLFDMRELWAPLGLFGFVAGAVLGGIGWIIGTLISSQGQLLKATLDAAVHTSPFIDDKVRARIMSL
jgi:hypothetical protein